MKPWRSGILKYTPNVRKHFENYAAGLSRRRQGDDAWYNDAKIMIEHGPTGDGAIIIW